MSLLEFNLEKPAYKRVPETATDNETKPRGTETEPEETEIPSDDADDSSRRPTLGIAVLLVAVVTALAIKRRRS